MTGRPDEGQLRVGLVAHVPATVPADQVLDTLTRTAVHAEEAGIDFLLTADGFAGAACPGPVWAGLQGPVAGMAVLPATRQLGVVAALQQRAYHPLHAAVALSTLSTFAPGRAGFLVQPDPLDGTTTLLPDPAPQADPAEWALDHLAAMRSLWAAAPGEPYSYDGPAFSMHGVASGSPRPVDLWMGVDATGSVGADVAERTGDWVLVAGDGAAPDARFVAVAERGQIAAVEVAVVLDRQQGRAEEAASRIGREGVLEAVRIGQASPLLFAGTPVATAQRLGTLHRLGCGIAVLHVIRAEGPLPWELVDELLAGLVGSGVRRDPREWGWSR